MSGSLSEFKKFEIQAYRRPKDPAILRRTHVPFAGSPRRHPTDVQRVFLIPDPYSTSSFYYEFDTSDIDYAEELPSVVDLDGETTTMVRVWVRKRSVAVRSIPFIVDDMTGR